MTMPSQRNGFAAIAAITLAFLDSGARAQAPGSTIPNPLGPEWVGPASTYNAYLRSLKPREPLVSAPDLRALGTAPNNTPYCQSSGGWLGGVYVYQPPQQSPRAFCVANDGTGDRGVGTPVRTWAAPGTPFSWVAWSTNKLIPKSAVAPFVQTNGRPMFACRADETGTPSTRRSVVGYVGDDGRCYGISLEGFAAAGAGATYAGQPKGFDEFQLMVRSTEPSSLVPDARWIAVRGARLPRGVFNKHAGQVACKGQQNGNTWAGYVDPGTNECNLFTWYGSTARARVRDYEVYQVVNCSTKDTYPILGALRTADGKCTYTHEGRVQTTDNFNVSAPGSVPYTKVNGKDYWLCSAPGLIGFTNFSPSGTTSRACTDGQRTVTHPRGTDITYFLAPPDERG